MIYKNIKSLCEKKNMSICALEKKAGLANGTIGKWKESSPTIDNVQSVAKVLGVKISKLIS